MMILPFYGLIHMRFILVGTMALICYSSLFAQDRAETVELQNDKKDDSTKVEVEGGSGNLAKQDESAEQEQADHLITNFPGFTIDFKAQEVLMDARVCLDEGILEYLACTKGTFDHEAIFDTKAKPELLHASLLFLGMEPDPRFVQMGSVIWDLTGERPNCLLKIYVEWEEAGELMRIDLEHFLVNRESEDEEEFFDLEDDPNSYWVFTGSFFFKSGEEQVYAANENGGVVAIWMNPSCVIQYGKTLENPYQGEDSGLEINTEVCPPAGTEVKLVFKPFSPPMKKKKDQTEEREKQPRGED